MAPEALDLGWWRRTSTFTDVGGCRGGGPG